LAFSTLKDKRKKVEISSITNTYAKAVVEIPRQIGVLPRPEYEKLRRAAEDARKSSLAGGAGGT